MFRKNVALACCIVAALSMPVMTTLSMPVVTFAEETETEEVAIEEAYETLQSEYEELQERYNELLEEYNELLEKYNALIETEVETEDPDAPEYDISATVNSVDESTFTVTTSKGNVYTFELGDYELNIGETVSFKYKGIISSEYDIQPGTISELEVTEEASDTAKYETGITYDNLARNPDDYEYEYVKFSGKVVQAIEADDDGLGAVRLAINGDYNQIIYCLYYDDILDFRILEDDEITIYGMSFGLVSYTSTLGSTITLPCVYVEQIDQ